MKYIYDAKTNAFYPVALKDDYVNAGLWPKGGVETDEDIFAKFQVPPPGKMRIAGEDGYPTWGDIPPLSHEEQIIAAEQQKTTLRVLADSEITWRQDAVDAGIATAEETAALAEWKKYRVLLMRVDTSGAPDIEWPTPPA